MFLPLHLHYTLYRTTPPTHLQGRIGLLSSSSTTHQRQSFALSTCPLSSYARDSPNHASELSHPEPSLVSVLRSMYPLSRAARRLSSADEGSVWRAAGLPLDGSFGCCVVIGSCNGVDVDKGTEVIVDDGVVVSNEGRAGSETIFCSYVSKSRLEMPTIASG